MIKIKKRYYINFRADYYLTMSNTNYQIKLNFIL